MKKLWLLLLLTALTAAMLAGCASSADSLATPTPGVNGGTDGVFPELNTTNVPNATNGTANTDAPENGGIQTPDEARKASKNMAEAIERLSEVDDAYVLALGNTALVGVEFGPEYQGKLDDRIKKMVLTRVRTVDKSINSVAVTDDVKWLQDIQALTESLDTAPDLNTLRARMDDLVQQISVYTE